MHSGGAVIMAVVALFFSLACTATGAPSAKQRQLQELDATDDLERDPSRLAKIFLAASSAARNVVAGEGSLWSTLSADVQQQAAASSLRAAAAFPGYPENFPRFMRAKEAVTVANPSPAAAFGAMYDATTGLSEPSVSDLLYS